MVVIALMAAAGLNARADVMDCRVSVHVYEGERERERIINMSTSLSLSTIATLWL